ncbi:putative lipase [Talaromyces proteolyticus]|uniref:sn-1-specific diacylglycerol lipase n=1 Tax=Talaromyces proteolyticus TaxID=1131652 RepID=A0AAD4Q3Y9_9EURO|nr:putative lipase [Talaromyces proteolyticus]KAH8705594.1 putative lipase [Talaromyces proteolyticus]
MTEYPLVPTSVHDSRDDPIVKNSENSNTILQATSRAAVTGATLLPRSIASVVSFLAQSTSLSLRVGTYFGGAAIGGARVTTLTGLELSRALVEAVLTRAGHEVAGRSHGEYGQIEAESLLERSLAALHTTVTSASFFAAAGFHLSEVALSSISNVSQNLLYSLDAILGSTESSRAIASIITLIHREFSKNQGGNNDDLVGVGDLLVGAIGFALLQRWGRRNTDRQLRESEGEVTIWDVVILDNGLRADVIGTQTQEYAHETTNNAHDLSRPASFLAPGRNEEPFEALEHVNSLTNASIRSWNFSSEEQPQLSDEDIRLYIMKQLPQGSRASVRTEVVTARTITVDVYDDDTAEIAAPPGTTMVEERFHHDHDTLGAKRLPKHTIVFRTAFNESQSADLNPNDFGAHPVSPASPRQTRTGPKGFLQPKTLPTTSRDAGKTKSGSSESANKPLQPALSTGNVTEKEETKPLQVASSSSLSGSETPRNSFGKASLSKIAQKVKAGPVEKNGANSSKSLVKKAPKRTNGSNSHTTPEAMKASKAESSSDTTIASNNRISRARENRPQTPALPSIKPPPRVPPKDYSRYRSTPSPTTAKTQKHFRSSSRTDYFTVNNRNSESFGPHTDAYSICSVDSRPGSASFTRTHFRSSSSLSRTRAEDVTILNHDSPQTPGLSQSHRRSQSFVPSIYSMATGSETSLILAPRPRKSVYEDESTIVGLNRNGLVPGIFPQNHLVNNIRRFCRFSSASYGSNALKFMGTPHDQKMIQYYDPNNHEHSSFSNITGLPPSAILLSSYFDPAGGTNSEGETQSGFPLVHYLSLDHESKAVVLTLRGTWGFEDILTDMTCDYDDLEWQGKSWKVHKGMHASASRLLEGGGGRVMATIKAALEEFPDYGVVFCGHSLGGGVAALLATMISQPNAYPQGPSFVTASALQAARPLLITADHQQQASKVFSLPSDRPIHVYAFGPPACMSPFLRRATRGLITTVINGKDVVPSLSLGILHDFRSVALSFKNDTTGSKSHIRSRVLEGLRQNILNKFYVNQPPIPMNAGEGLGEDSWAWSALQSLREEMTAPKLLPPGEVFVVDTMRVLQRNAFTTRTMSAHDTHPQLGRPATRVQLKFIRNVDAYFGELNFSSGMLGDHNPVRYEAGLASLARGVIDE